MIFLLSVVLRLISVIETEILTVIYVCTLEILAENLCAEKCCLELYDNDYILRNYIMQASQKRQFGHKSFSQAPLSPALSL